MKIGHRGAKIAAVALVGVLALTACGRSNTGESESGSDEATGILSIDDSPATGEITIWAMGEEGENLPKFAATFEEANPEASVKVTTIPWADVQTKVQTAVSTGTVPDAIMIGTSQMPMIIATGGLTTVPEGVTDSSDYFEGAVDSTVAQGKTYGVPWYVETRVLYYRTDLAKAAGLSAPTTWDELKSFTQGFIDNGAEYGIALPMGAAEDATQVILPFYASLGGEVLNSSGDAYDIDNEQMAEAIDFYGSFFEEKIAPRAGYGDEQTAKFVDGSNPSFISGPWMINVLTELKDAEWVEKNVSTAVVPSGTNSNDSYIGGANLGVFKDAKNAEGAWKFVRWLSEAETQQSWFDLTGDLPAVKTAWDYPALTENDRVQVINQQLENTVAPPTVPSWEEVSATIETEAEKVASGVTTGAEAAATSQKKAESLGLGW